MKIILISGTPGTGKTELLNKLCSLTGAYCLNTGRIVFEEELTVAYDFMRDTYVYDEHALENRLLELIKDKELVFIETIDPCLLRDKTYLVIVTRCSDSELLKKRLSDKGWKKEKIEENLEAEFMGLIEEQAVLCKGEDNVLIVDTCKESINDVVEKIMSHLFSRS